MARRLAFDPNAFAEFTSWADNNLKYFLKIQELIKNIQRDPFGGIGKPEPLKHNKHGYWSRRIDATHRIVYKVTDDEIRIISCEHHYQKL